MFPTWGSFKRFAAFAAVVVLSYKAPDIFLNNKISKRTNAIRKGLPDALDLLTTNPDDPTSATNTAYLSHIDGVVAESTFYNNDNTPTTWQATIRQAKATSPRSPA